MRAGDQRTEQTSPSEELTAIVLRAERLGFSRWQVATALESARPAWKRSSNTPD
jgi:hypothetical protein